MTASLHITPSRATSSNGLNLDGAKWYFYQSGTTTPQSVYTTAALSTPHSNPVEADAAGKFPNIFFDATLSYRGVLKTADDVTTIYDIDPINTDTLSQLAASGGSDLIGFLQAGTGAVARTAQDKMRDVVSVKDFGAVGDGVTDDTAAIAAAITYAKTLSKPELVIDAGVYLTSSTLTFDLPNYSTIRFIGEILTATGNPAIRIGSTSTNYFGYCVHGVKVRRSSNDTTNGSTGVQLRNIVACHIDIRECTGFQDGVLCLADQGNGGVSYNEIHLGFIHDNRYNLHLQATGVGYVNENMFFGGTFNHSSGYPAVSTVNIWIDYATYRHNNNRFFCPSLEDNSTLAVAAIINGDNNILIHPRLERSVSSSTYEIQFTANSGENQIFGTAFSILTTNIADSGVGNSWETREGRLYQSQTTDTAGRAVVVARGLASNDARVFSGLSTSGTENFFVRGDGRVSSASSGYFETGVRWSTSSGTRNDRGLFSGSGSPEGVVTANPGSMYLNTAGGAGTTLYVKESGGSNTGWVAK